MQISFNNLKYYFITTLILTYFNFNLKYIVTSAKYGTLSMASMVGG